MVALCGIPNPRPFIQYRRWDSNSHARHLLLRQARLPFRHSGMPAQFHLYTAVSFIFAGPIPPVLLCKRVAAVGLEPTRRDRQRILSPLCLPIPARRQIVNSLKFSLKQYLIARVYITIITNNKNWLYCKTFLPKRKEYLISLYDY